MQQKSTFAVLGVLGLGPCSGYDIKKIFRENLDFAWRETDGSIYPALKNLVKNGLTERKSQRKSGPRGRILYQITEKGRQELQNWLSSPIDRELNRSELLLRLNFLGRERLEDSLELVSAYGEEIRADMARINTQFEEKKELFGGVVDCALSDISMRWAKMRLEAELQWCREVKLELDYLRDPRI